MSSSFSGVPAPFDALASVAAAAARSVASRFGAPLPDCAASGPDCSARACSVAARSGSVPPVLSPAIQRCSVKQV